ncbi:MAG: PepSY domain-containing protein [Micropepsaceae bacterium]
MTATHSFPDEAAPAPKRKGALWQAMVVTHRYLGVAIALLMLVWFLSGIVMMYVPYPQRSETERVSALPQISWAACCDFSGVAMADNDTLARAQLENVAGRPILRIRRPPRADIIADLQQGQSLVIGNDTARQVGADSAARILGGANIISAELIDYDQWTVGDNGAGRRPVYRLAFDDPNHMRLYVSAITGEVIVWTTRGQRFGNWFGAIPHWLYFSALRSNGPLWLQIIIWTSVLGIFLTLIGLYLGITRFRVSKTGRLSPYAGWYYWHHIIGLVFGIVTLTWVASGLFSMNPWGFLESRPDNAAERLAGPPQNWSSIRSSLEALEANPMDGVVSLTTQPFDGRLFWLARFEDGNVLRLDENGNVQDASSDELAAAARLLAGENAIESAALSESEDSYYFRFQGFAEREPLILPVYRVIVEDDEHTSYYLDPSNTRLLARFDSARRGYRWLFDGLHRFDFFAWLRIRPLWDFIVLFLMIGGTAGVGTGVYLAFRRIKLDIDQVFKRRTPEQKSAPLP